MTNFNDPQNVMASKRYVKGLVEYKAPGEIIQPALDKLKTTNMIVHLSGNNEIKNANTDNTKNTAFGRINIQATIELDENVQYELGILFALDLNVPKVKIYRGPKVNVCLNLCIFGADDIVTFDMTTGFQIEHVVNFLKEQAAKIKHMQKTIQAMKARLVKPDELERSVGHIILKNAALGRAAKVGAHAVDFGMELLTDERSRYYYRQEKFNHWLLYNAFTEHYSAKKMPLFDVPERVFHTNELINEALKLN